MIALLGAAHAADPACLAVSSAVPLTCAQVDRALTWVPSCRARDDGSLRLRSRRSVFAEARVDRLERALSDLGDVTPVAHLVVSTHPADARDRLDAAPGDGRYDAVGDGDGARVYVLDSGIATTVRGRLHLASGKAVVDCSTSTLAACNKHGTLVAGAVGGDTVGVAPGAVIVPVDVFDARGTACASDVADGMRWIAAEERGRVSRGGAPGAIANLSAECPGACREPDLALLREAALALEDAGVLLVVAAGNQPPTGPGLPSLPGVVAVGTTGGTTSGAPITAPAPVWTLAFTEDGIGPNWFEGTSASAAVVSGVLAIDLALARAHGCLANDPDAVAGRLKDQLLGRSGPGGAVCSRACPTDPCGGPPAARCAAWKACGDP